MTTSIVFLLKKKLNRHRLCVGYARFCALLLLLLQLFEMFVGFEEENENLELDSAVCSPSSTRLAESH